MNTATQPRQVLGAEPVRLVIGPGVPTVSHEAGRPAGRVVHVPIGKAVFPCIVNFGDEDGGTSVDFVELGDQWWPAWKGGPITPEFRSQLRDALCSMDWN